MTRTGETRLHLLPQPSRVYIVKRNKSTGLKQQKTPDPSHCTRTRLKLCGTIATTKDKLYARLAVHDCVISRVLLKEEGESCWELGSCVR